MLYLVSHVSINSYSVVIWDLGRKEAVCGAPAAVLSAGATYCVAFANNTNDVFVTGGK